MNVIPRDQHCISRRNISDNALKVMSRLRSQNHQAYLVGGAVRDLLLGGHPKDFDIATDATPEQVKQLFRNSRIIGRRFRIVHVRFGREVIEVTTFRGHHQSETATAGRPPSTNDGRETDARRSASGMLLRDNVFGTLEEDAIRRDLTINALYYDAGSFKLLDQVDGLTDLNTRQIRVIGDPEVRYREDPVRMLRVLRFAAKLDFEIESNTLAAISRCAPMLANIPPARLFDEFGKLFLSGYGLAAFRYLNGHQLLGFLFPDTVDAIRRSDTVIPLLEAALTNTDQRVREEKPVTPAFLLAAFLWYPVTRLARQLEQTGEPKPAAMHAAGQQVLARQVQQVAIPRRFSLPMREIWEYQLRLEKRQGRRAAELVDQRRFRAAYDFLLLREQAGEQTEGLGDWWTQFQTLPLEQRLREAGAGGSQRRRPRKRRPQRTAGHPA